MRSKTRAGAAAGLCCLMAALAAAAVRAQDRPEGGGERPKGSAVYGRAVYEDTGRPVRRARVVMLGLESRGPESSAITNARGEFRVEGLAAGHYYAAVDAGGVISPISFLAVEELRDTPDTRDLAGRFDEVEVDGKADKELTVRARRGAAVSGRVTYSDGEPAVSVTVHVMRRSDGRLVKFLLGMSRETMSTLRTDDRGAYRVSGLPPGDYVVAVSEAADHSGAGTGAEHGGFSDAAFFRGLFGQHLLMTFHPSAATAKDAGVLSLGAGEQRDDVDISIRDREAYEVAGVVRLRRGGRPVPNAKVTLARSDEGGGRPAFLNPLFEEDPRFSTSTDPEGRWKFMELPAGPYTITVTPPEEPQSSSAVMSTNLSASSTLSVEPGTAGPPPPRQRRRRAAPARRELNLSGDVADYLVELGDGARVSGTVTAEGGDLPDYQSIWVIEQGEDDSQFEGPYGRPGRGSVVGGAFSIEGLAAGKYYVRLEAPPAGGELYIKAMTWNGVDLLREPLEVAEGADVEGVRVVYASGTAKVTARVVGAGAAAAGKGAENFTVYFVKPASLREGAAAAAPSYCPTLAADSCVATLAPGEYLLVALPGPPGRRSDYGEVRRLAASAPRVLVRAGEAKSVEVAAPAQK